MLQLGPIPLPQSRLTRGKALAASAVAVGVNTEGNVKVMPPPSMGKVLQGTQLHPGTQQHRGEAVVPSTQLPALAVNNTVVIMAEGKDGQLHDFLGGIVASLDPKTLWHFEEVGPNRCQVAASTGLLSAGVFDNWPTKVMCGEEEEAFSNLQADGRCSDILLVPLDMLRRCKGAWMHVLPYILSYQHAYLNKCTFLSPCS